MKEADPTNNFSRFHLAARENIGVGAVERLPDGYDTVLGRTFYSYVSNGRSFRTEEGVDISGGERQKVALARAFLRTGPAGDGAETGTGDIPSGAQLLILDEPTATPDAKAELVARGGRYADLFERQASRYR